MLNVEFIYYFSQVSDLKSFFPLKCRFYILKEKNTNSVSRFRVLCIELKMSFFSTEATLLFPA